MWQTIIKGPHQCSKSKQEITTEAELDELIVDNFDLTKDTK